MIHCHRGELRPLVTLDRFRLAMTSHQITQDSRHIDSSKSLAHVQSKTLSREHVDHRQHPHLPAVRQRVMHEVHGPTLGRSGSWLQLASDNRRPSPFRSLPFKSEPFFGVQPVNPLVVDRPTFPTQDHVQPSIAVADSHRRDLLQPSPELFLMWPAGSISDRRTRETADQAGPPLRYPICFDSPTGPRPLLRRSQNFFFRDSCRMCLSKDRSATNCLSFLFSSRS